MNDCFQTETLFFTTTFDTGKQNMKTTAIALLFVVASSLSARAEQGRSFDDRPKISVSGEAVVEVKPDKIVILFGIQTNDKDITIAKK